MISQPLVSIVVLNWNRLEETKRCLNSCLQQTYANIEIILVDNNSNDGSEFYFNSFHSKVKHIKFRKNFGCPGGRNRAIQYCQGEFVFFVDNDGLLHERAVEIAVAIINSSVNISVVNGIIKDFSDLSEVDLKFKIVNKGYENIILFNGGICLIRKLVFTKIANYPEEYVYGGEETFLALNVLNSNYNIVQSEGVVLWHKKSILARNKSKELLHLLENVFLNAYQLYPLIVLLLYIPYYCIAYTFYACKNQILLDYLKMFVRLPRKLKNFKRTPVKLNTVAKFWGLVKIRDVVTYLF